MDKTNQRTTEHVRDSHGNVAFERPQQKKNSGMTRILGYTAGALALALTVTALLLHSSTQTNAQNKKRIDDLQQLQSQQQAPMTQTINPARQDIAFQDTTNHGNQQHQARTFKHKFQQPVQHHTGHQHCAPGENCAPTIAPHHTQASEKITPRHTATEKHAITPRHTTTEKHVPLTRPVPHASRPIRAVPIPARLTPQQQQDAVKDCVDKNC